MNDIGLYAGAGGMLLLFVGILVVAIFSEGGEGGETFGVCSPIRFASLTARQPATAPRRRIIAELAPPAGWRDTLTIPAPAPAWYDDDDDIEPELVPVAVPVQTPAPDHDAPIPVEWPTRIVQPVPLSRR